MVKLQKQKEKRTAEQRQEEGDDSDGSIIGVGPILSFFFPDSVVVKLSIWLCSDSPSAAATRLDFVMINSDQQPSYYMVPQQVSICPRVYFSAAVIWCPGYKLYIYSISWTLELHDT
jgi:hypothetical protein